MKGDEKMLFRTKKENEYLRNEVMRLRRLCDEKDSYFIEVIADGLRHGSKLAAKHMSDRKKFVNGKN